MNALQSLITTSVLVLSSLALGSCNNNKDEETPSQLSGAEEAQEPAPSQVEPEIDDALIQHMRAECPMVVRGAKVEVSDTEGGVALTFTTDEEQVADLRTRVRHMADMYEHHGGRGWMIWHHMGRDGPMGRGRHMGQGGHMGRGPHDRFRDAHGIPLPAATATVTEIDRGARLELEPVDPSDLDALRQHVRTHQERMASGECWLWQQS